MCLYLCHCQQSEDFQTLKGLLSSHQCSHSPLVRAGWKEGTPCLWTISSVWWESMEILELFQGDSMLRNHFLTVESYLYPGYGIKNEVRIGTCFIQPPPGLFLLFPDICMYMLPHLYAQLPSFNLFGVGGPGGHWSHTWSLGWSRNARDSAKGLVHIKHACCFSPLSFLSSH